MFKRGRRGYSPAPRILRNQTDPERGELFDVRLFEFATVVPEDKKADVEPVIIGSDSTYASQVQSDPILSGSINLVDAVLGRDSHFTHPQNGARSRIRLDISRGNPEMPPEQHDPQIRHREITHTDNLFYASTTLYRPGTRYLVGEFVQRKTGANDSGLEYVFPHGFDVMQDEWNELDALASGVRMYRLGPYNVHEKPVDVPADGLFVGISAEFL